MPSRKAVLSLAVLLLRSVPLALAQGTYTQIDYPGAVQTYCRGINKAGDISGSYQDSSGNYHGFLRSGVIYTTIDYPGGQDTYLNGMNDVGQIVGVSIPAFVYDIQTQTFAEVKYPDAAYTDPLSINNAGTIAGTYYADNNQGQGFRLTGSTYRSIAVRNSKETHVVGVSSSGELVGYALTHDRSSNFSFNQKGFQRLVIPSQGALVYGISPSGSALVGNNGGSAGFVYQNTTLTTLQFPGGDYTTPTGVNDAGDVVGSFQVNVTYFHGFLWKPPADAGKK